MKSIYEIINNAKDELIRATYILEGNDAPEISTLLSDIDDTLEQMEELKDKIDFALILANNMGWKDCDNAIGTTDNKDWLERYIEVASKIELNYNQSENLDSEWACRKAVDITNTWIKELYDVSNQ